METKEFLERLQDHVNQFGKLPYPLRLKDMARKSNIAGPRLEIPNPEEKMELHLAQSFLSMVEKFNLGRSPNFEMTKILSHIDENLTILLERMRHTDDEEEEENEEKKEEDEDEESKRNPRRLKI
jgi:hypothetical protein